MSTVLDAKGRTWPNHLQVGWTTFEGSRELYRDAWRNLVARLETLFPLLGMKLEPVELTWTQPPKEPKGARWSATTLRRVDKLLDSGELVSVGSTYKVAGRPVLSSRSAVIDIDADGFMPDQGGTIGVVIDTMVLSAEEEDAIADAFASWLPQFAEPTRAVWGFVTSDPHWFPMVETPYEHHYRLPDYGRPHARKHPRGYYWANLLGAEHLDGLGGHDAVRERAAASGLLTSSVCVGGRPRYLTVRIPSAMTSYADGELLAVKNLLDPILLKGPPKHRKEPSRLLLA